MPIRLPLFICLVAGLVMFFQYFSNHPIARLIYQTVTNDWWQVIFAFTLIVGVVSFFKITLKKIIQKKDIFYSLLALGGLLLMPLLALYGGTEIESPFQWAFENLLAPMQATVFSLLAFFVASASFRGFRARSVPAAILLGAALLVLIGRIPLPESVAESISKLGFWIKDYPSMAARRAILIGIGLGSMTTALRVILGIERTYLSGK